VIAPLLQERVTGGLAVHRLDRLGEFHAVRVEGSGSRFEIGLALRAFLHREDGKTGVLC
jgi:hypothetical protein